MLIGAFVGLAFYETLADEVGEGGHADTFGSWLAGSKMLFFVRRHFRPTWAPHCMVELINVQHVMSGVDHGFGNHLRCMSTSAHGKINFLWDVSWKRRRTQLSHC